MKNEKRSSTLMQLLKKFFKPKKSSQKSNPLERERRWTYRNE